ncbi:MAG: serine/threonine protein kinase [Proteobacteria bacterium]|nr:serine/threonine protein kinase [Pseudomonadota bacterium]MCP4919635.1 serine/threonine protein kinase [Pseudomonadota bacterium]
MRPGGLAQDDALKLLEPLAAAIDHLHGLGIVHRDLKPANVKVRPDGTPVVLDLGIAKDESRATGLTATATTMGTLAWMAPEQADAKTAGPPADRYAFGMIAYALLTGGMPWPPGTSDARVLTCKLTGKLESAGSKRSDLGVGMARAIERLLALDPAHRPASCVGALDAPLPGRTWGWARPSGGSASWTRRESVSTRR